MFALYSTLIPSALTSQYDIVKKYYKENDWDR